MSDRSVPEPDAVQRRVLRVLLLAQVLAGAGLAAGITVGALLAEDMLGSTSAAGVPAALLTAGSAAAALLVAQLSDRSGRRPGLAAGYAVGAAGAAGVVLAAAVDNVPLLFVALVLYGSGSATNLQARYAGADLAPVERRGRAVSTVLVATTLGAVVGPNLVGPTGSLAEAIGVRSLAGPFLLAGAAYAFAAVAVQVLLRPDPLLTARARASAPASAATPAPTSPDGADPAGSSPDDTSATLRLAAAAMVVTQLVMVAVMTMTPVHMRDHGHSVSAAGFVISLHVAAMFLPSPLTGALVDRVGRRPVLAAGSLTLVGAGVLAALAPDDSVALLAVALVLLGLGWNLGLVAGTALVTDAVPLASRARTQGRVDLGVALAGATGGIGSGFMVAQTDFVGLTLAGGVLALCLLPLVLTAQLDGPRPG